MNARLKLSLLALILAGAFTLSPVTLAQEEEPPTDQPDKWKEAPAEFVGSFVKALKATPRYQFAEALRRDKLEPEIEKWKKDTGMEVNVTWQNYLLVHLQQDEREIKIPEKGTWWLRVYKGWGPAGEQEMLIFSRTDRSTAGYRVSAAALKDLELPYLEHIEIRRALNRSVGRYSVQNEQLSTVVAALCKEAAAGKANVDYVVRSDPGSQVQISMQMSGRTVFECLQLVAGSVGWNVYVNPDLNRGDKPYPTLEFHDAMVSTQDAEWLWYNRELVNLRDHPESPVVTPLDAVKEAFMREVKDVQSERFVVMLKPIVKD